MSRFGATSRVNLSFVGDDWKGAYVDVAVPTYDETETLAELRAEGNIVETAKAMMAYAEEHFVAGQAPVNGELVDLKASDLRNLPIHAVKKITDTLNGEGLLDPKS